MPPSDAPFIEPGRLLGEHVDSVNAICSAGLLVTDKDIIRMRGEQIIGIRSEELGQIIAVAENDVE
jgi:hypothetical protein